MRKTVEVAALFLFGRGKSRRMNSKEFFVLLFAR